MELLQLRYFYESANNENFSKTAEKYMVPISSVSASVRRLEKELGCKLFDRSCNSITLNRNGRKLQQTLYNVFSELDGVIADLSFSENDNREIKMLVRAVRSDITEYISEYNKKHPQIVFKVVFDFGETDFEDYDIIIDEKNDSLYRDYESFELFNLCIRMKVSTKSPLVGKKLTLKQLSSQSFVSLSENSNMYKMLIKACRSAGFFPNVVALINDIECHEKMIESGIGIGLGRENLKSADKNKIAFLDVTDFNERYIIYTYYKKSAAHGNVRHFLNFLKNKDKKFN